MTNDEQRTETSKQGGNNDVNKEMLATLKNLQTDMETLRSENETLKKELTTSKFNSKTVSNMTVQSMAR